MLSKHRPVQQTKVSANVIDLSPGCFALEVGRWIFFFFETQLLCDLTHGKRRQIIIRMLQKGFF